MENQTSRKNQKNQKSKIKKSKNQENLKSNDTIIAFNGIGRHDFFD